MKIIHKIILMIYTIFTVKNSDDLTYNLIIIMVHTTQIYLKIIVHYYQTIIKF